MGRTFEALRQKDVCGSRVAVPPANVRPFAAEPDEPEATIPFIEVGGPRQQTASPCCRKVPAAASDAVKPPQPYPVLFQPVAVETEGLPPAAQRFAPELIAYHQPRHAVSAHYRALWDGLAAALPAQSPQILLFSSPFAGTGTTTVLLNVALTAARQNRQRVIVVDANWGQPAVAARLGLPAAPGLREVLGWSVPLDQAVRPSGQPNLMVLAAGAETAGKSVRLVGEPMWSVLRQLRERFDLILVDAPCWDGRPEIVALGSACDAVYLVLRQADAETPPTSDLVAAMPRGVSSFRGCILTQAS